MTSRLSVILLSLWLGVVSTGCTLTAPTPARSAFLPQLDVARVASSEAPLPGLLLVGTFSVAEAFAGKSMVYRFAEHRYEADFYNEFFVSPRDFVSQSALEWLQRAHLFESVVPAAGTRARHALLLQGSVNEMYADLRDAQQPAAVLSIQFYLVDDSLAGRPVRLAQQLRQVMPMADASAAAYADALSRAMTSIFTELARQVRAGVGRSGAES